MTDMQVVGDICMTIAFVANTQISMCDLYESLGLPCYRPVKEKTE